MSSDYFDTVACGTDLDLLLLQDYKRDAFREAYLQCSNVIQNMEKELRTACHAPDAKVDYVLKVRCTVPVIVASHFSWASLTSFYFSWCN